MARSKRKQFSLFELGEVAEVLFCKAHVVEVVATAAETCMAIPMI
jgi:hypothetical protein